MRVRRLKMAVSKWRRREKEMGRKKGERFWPYHFNMNLHVCRLNFYLVKNSLSGMYKYCIRWKYVHLANTFSSIDSKTHNTADFRGQGGKKKNCLNRLCKLPLQKWATSLCLQSLYLIEPEPLLIKKIVSSVWSRQQMEIVQSKWLTDLLNIVSYLSVWTGETRWKGSTCVSCSFHLLFPYLSL